MSVGTTRFVNTIVPVCNGFDFHTEAQRTAREGQRRRICKTCFRGHCLLLRQFRYCNPRKILPLPPSGRSLSLCVEYLSICSKQVCLAALFFPGEPGDAIEEYRVRCFSMAPRFCGAINPQAQVHKPGGCEPPKRTSGVCSGRRLPATRTGAPTLTPACPPRSKNPPQSSAPRYS